MRIQNIFFLFMLFLAACGSNQDDPKNTFSDPNVVSLLEAAIIGDGKSLTKYLDSIPDINVVSQSGITPLYWLIVDSNTRNIEWAVGELLNAGADPHFVPEGWKYSSFLWAVRRGQVKVVKAMLEAGVDVNRLYSKLNLEPTPIFHALSSRDSFTLNLLIDAGAHLEFRNSLGQTPLLYARTNNWELAYILLKNGANFNAKDMWGHTIVWPIENNGYGILESEIDWRAKVVEFLRNKGVEVNPKR